MHQAEKVYNIYYDADTGAVIMDWIGYATSEDFRAGTLLMFQTMKNHKTTKVVGNITDFILIGREDQKWLLEEFLPLAINHGFRKCALTIPLHYFNKVAVETVVNNIANKNLEVRLFSNLNDAKNWIK